MRGGVALAGTLILTGCSGGGDIKVPGPQAPDTITVTSAAFDDGGRIPRQYTCRGAGRVPELAWQGVPGAAESLALVVSDPDAPGGGFVHWVLYDLPAHDGGVSSGATPPDARETDNSAGKTGWYPPCPPSGTHHYVFTVYALADRVRGGSAQDVLDEIGRLSVARGTLTGVVSAGARGVGRGSVSRRSR